MSADNCCTKTLDLGCWSCCQKFIELPIVYPSTGEFRVWFKYVGRRLFRTLTGVEGEPVIIPVSGLNEEFTFYGYLTDPDNAAWPFTVDGVVYDCFSFKFHEGVELQPEPSGACSPATVNINGVEVATPASGATADLEVVDQDGNPIGSLVSGQWVITISEDVADTIIPYATEVAALADTTTIPTDKQLVKVKDTNRGYWGDGASTVAALVTAQVFLLPVTENNKGLLVTTNGENLQIQLNEP